MYTPRVAPEVPFDRGTIAGAREQATLRRGDADIYDQVPFAINWLWYERMLATLEECQELREEIKKYV